MGGVGLSRRARSGLTQASRVEPCQASRLGSVKSKGVLGHSGHAKGVDFSQSRNLGAEIRRSVLNGGLGARVRNVTLRDAT